MVGDVFGDDADNARPEYQGEDFNYVAKMLGQKPSADRGLSAEAAVLSLHCFVKAIALHFGPAGSATCTWPGMKTHPWEPRDPWTPPVKSPELLALLEPLPDEPTSRRQVRDKNAVREYVRKLTGRIWRVEERPPSTVGVKGVCWHTGCSKDTEHSSNDFCSKRCQYHALRGTPVQWNARDRTYYVLVSPLDAEAPAAAGTP